MSVEHVTCDECKTTFEVTYGPETPVFNNVRDSKWATVLCPNGHPARYARFVNKDGIVVLSRNQVTWIR
jgi:hypothetical protein